MLIDLICTTCEEYSIINLYALGNIPKKKLENAVRFFPIAEAKRTFMLYDSTVFGSCKTGIALCDNGVFYKNSWSTEPRYNHFTWEQFSKLDIYLKGNHIYFGDEDKVFIPSVGKNELIELLKRIKKLVCYEEKQLGNSDTIIEADKGTAWMIAIDGKQYGPMEQEEIQRKLIDNLFKPELTLVWKPNMDNWELISNVPEFSDLLQMVNSKITPPPIPDIYQTSIPKDDLRIDINNCTMEELLAFECINVERAKCLIEARQGGKKFYSIEDIIGILDLKPHQVEEIKEKLVFNIPRAFRSVRKIEF